MNYGKGDIVAFLNDVGTGEVVAVEGGEVLVLNEEGFEEWYPASELILRKRFDVTHVEKKDRVETKPERVGNFSKPSVMEKDLHFASLVDFPKNFTNYEMLQIQLREAQKAVEHARKAGIKKLILIHGVGEGRLREEVHSLLERMDKLSFYDASYDKFGSGATEVELF